jgi:tellurite resistance protein
MPDAKRIYELMVMTAWTDGKVEAKEALAVHDIAQAMPDFKALEGKAELSKKMKARIDEIGLDAAVREKAAEVTDRLDQEMAFRFCARVLNADSDLSLEEANVLSALQEVFGFSGEDVKRLMRNLEGA